MRRGRPTKALEITDENREKLSLIARRPKAAQSMAMRADCAWLRRRDEQLGSGSEVAHHRRNGRQVAGAVSTVGAGWLLDEPRVGAPRKIGDREIEEVVTKTLESMPANSTHWSTRLTARETSLTQNAIVRIWRAFRLQPHRVENFKF
ncbi:MAG: putative transposase, partial [Bryobacterales bacterium]|nr:putative transposase [Bryobacterales bacterium]